MMLERGSGVSEDERAEIKKEKTDEYWMKVGKLLGARL